MCIRDRGDSLYETIQSVRIIHKSGDEGGGGGGGGGVGGGVGDRPEDEGRLREMRRVSADRLLLHARCLEFTHPGTKQRTTVIAPTPF